MDFVLSTRVLLRVRDHLRQEDVARALAVFRELLPSDQAHVLGQLSKAERQRIMAELQPREAAEILERLDGRLAPYLVSDLAAARLSTILDEMEPDSAADLLDDLEPAQRKAVLARMANAKAVRSLLSYADDSIGGLMTSNYMAYPTTALVGEVLRALQERPADAEQIPYVYVVDDKFHLHGMVRLADLLRMHPEQPLGLIADPEFVPVLIDEDREDAAKRISEHRLYAIPVVSDEGRLLGVITADDALEAQETEASEDIYRGAGIVVSDHEVARSDLLVRGSLWRVLRARMPWLLLTLLGGMVAGAVVGTFEETLESVLALALFIPVLMDMGGNVGTQSDEVFIRAHTLGQIDLRRFGRHLVKETLVGAGIGAIMGMLAGVIAFVWQGDIRLGLVVGISMSGTLTLAAAIGFLTPYLLDKAGVDPATASSPFITTVKDITTLLIYFLVATWLLGHLL